MECFARNAIYPLSTVGVSNPNPPHTVRDYATLMDPTYHYGHHQRSGSRSLSSTTDPARYQQYQQYPSSAHAAGYVPTQGHSYEQSTYTPYYAEDPRRVPGQSVHANASYTGAAPPSPVHQYGSGHTANAPASGHHSHSYAAPGQPPLSPHLATAGYAHPYASSHSHASPHPPQSTYASQYLPTPAQSLHAPHAHSAHHRRGTPSAMHHGYQPPSSPEIERFPCDKCDKTFSRAHDRKRHYESQHAPHPPNHLCRYCTKGFSRGDSLKRHLDNGCDKDPSFNDGTSPS